MPNATVLEVEVPWRQICTHWEGWGKAYGELLPCRLALPVSHVVAEFDQHWSAFVDRESMDDGTETLPGVYSQLRAVHYPDLEAMLKSYPSLFSALVMEDLQTEFAEYILNSPHDVLSGEPAYFLQGISSVTVAGASVILEGTCCEFRRAEP
jgi:hypothetical protein